jgi:ribosome-associated protein
MDDLVFRSFTIPARELRFEFSRGGGPGGQNVNKVASKVALRFALATSDAVPDHLKQRLLAKLASRLVQGGELLIVASEHRDQARNREAAVARLTAMIEQALHVDKPRRATKPTRGAVERRIGEAKRRSAVKKLRRPPRDD